MSCISFAHYSIITRKKYWLAILALVFIFVYFCFSLIVKNSLNHFQKIKQLNLQYINLQKQLSLLTAESVNKYSLIDKKQMEAALLMLYQLIRRDPFQKQTIAPQMKFIGLIGIDNQHWKLLEDARHVIHKVAVQDKISSCYQQ